MHFRGNVLMYGMDGGRQSVYAGKKVVVADTPLLDFHLVECDHVHVALSCCFYCFR